MLFASTSQRKRKQSHTASRTYASLEARQLLTFLPPPPMTVNVAEFAQSVDDAVVRVDNDRLIIRTTGEENRIEMRLDQRYLQVNPANYNSLALQIDPSQYSSIVMLSGGDDAVRVAGYDLTAQMYPDRLWVAGPIGFDTPESIQINGSNFENVEVNQSNLRDFGPYILQSNNRIRMYGNEGADKLDMASDSTFAIATTASLTGEGYQLSTNVFGDLYVNGHGGDDVASITGTRGFTEDAFLVDQARPNGNDYYTARDNWARIRNDQWDGRFVNFETQRVDLLSGEDRIVVEDASQPAYWYRVDGSDVVGGFRRLINAEFIEIRGSDSSGETLRRPQGDGDFTEEANLVRWSGETSDTSGTELSHFPEEILPKYFDWTFVGFDRLVG